MIQVRFDEKSPSRLGLIFTEESSQSDPVVEARAAGLLFSVLQQPKPVSQAADLSMSRRFAKPAPPRRKPAARA